MWCVLVCVCDAYICGVCQCVCDAYICGVCDAYICGVCQCVCNACVCGVGDSFGQTDCVGQLGPHALVVTDCPSSTALFVARPCK